MRPTYGSLAVLSVFSLICKLSVPLFVMAAMDRVMTSRSLTTLGFLLVAIFGIVVVGTLLEQLRGKILRRMANHLDVNVGKRVFAQLYDHKTAANAASGVSIILDFNQVRDTLAGKTVTDLMDAMLSPLFIVVLFLLHPFFGLLGAGFVTASGLLYIVAHRAGLRGSEEATEASRKELAFVQATTRNADAIRVMGILPGLTRKWARHHFAALGWRSDTLERTSAIHSVSHLVTSCQYPAAVAVGLLLYLLGQISSGTIFAGMILLTRGVAPISSLFYHWEPIREAKSAYHRLNELLGPDRVEAKMLLPKPEGRLTVSNVYYRVSSDTGGTDKVLLNDISFGLEGGRALAIVGQSGAGKSTLVRVLSGALPPFHGSITLGGHDLSHWDPIDLGQHIGYVPQDVDFLPGTVAENIRRFRDAAPDDNQAVIEAARLAEVEDLIQSLPDGYNTKLGLGGHNLSGGERQRMALARAVFGNPSLVVLDEPNSNLDLRAEEALGRTIQELRERGTTVVLVTHKLNLLVFCDDVLVLHAGAVNAHGSRDEIMSRIPSQRLTSLRAIEGSR